MKCLKCSKPFKWKQFINGKARNLSNRRFCLECSPFGQHNTKQLHIPQKPNNKPSFIKIAVCICEICDKQYIYSKCRGNSLQKCTACKTKIARIRRKLKMILYKGGKCIKCNYDKCITALEFHHRDPTNKLFDIADSAYNRNWERVKNEIDKCDLLCSNCHREVEENNTSKKILKFIYAR